MTQPEVTAQGGLLLDARRMGVRVAHTIRDADAASELVPTTITLVAFLLLFWQPMYTLVRDWWSLPEAGHGLLLAPVAIWMAVKAGVRDDAKGNVTLGAAVLVVAVILRYMSGLAAELFTMRASMMLALGGLTIYRFGTRQLRTWWLPYLLLWLCIPLPELITQAIALPLQFKASQMGAALLRMRDVPVRLTGNVIRIPGNELFVTEACSGLRSLTALLSLAVLLGGLALRRPFMRALLVLVAVPVAVAINGVRVFFTGFFVYYIDPELGTGFMHLTEGWILFVVSFALLAGTTWIAVRVEQIISAREVSRG